MDFGLLIEQYGYPVLVVGCLLEGETILALAGFAARRGHLFLPWVMVVAAISGWIGDQIFFWLGRRHGTLVLQRMPSVAAQAQRVQRLILRYDAWVIVGVRFAYGLRIAGPVLIGTSGVSAARFAFFNGLGAILWATIVASLGWALGAAVESLLNEVHQYEVWLFALIAAVAIGLFLWHRLRDRSQRDRID